MTYLFVSVPSAGCAGRSSHSPSEELEALSLSKKPSLPVLIGSLVSALFRLLKLDEPPIAPT